MSLEIIPDSVNWLFQNNTNAISANSQHLFYSSNKKVVVLDQKTGKCRDLILNKQNYSVILVTCNNSFIATFSSDNQIRIFDIFSFCEVQTYPSVPLKGLKYRGKDLVCGNDSLCQVLNQDLQVLQEFPIPGFECLETTQDLFILSTSKETLICRYLNTSIIQTKFLTLSLWNEEYLAGMTTDSVKVFKISEEIQEILEIPLKKTKSKLKTPVFSLSWLSSSRLVYSSLSGDLILVNISPFQSQSFMNNPHSKAIQALIRRDEGFFSFGMDRFICSWHISEIQVDQASKCPKSYSMALAYMEPTWELQTLEASVCALASFGEKILVSCGKTGLFIYQLNTCNVHSRSWTRLANSSIVSIKICRNLTLAVLCTNESVVFVDLKQEKVIQSVKILVSRCEWIDDQSILAVTEGKKLVKVSISGKIDEFLTLKYEISSIFLHSCDFLFIGTIEGNIFKYSLSSKSRLSFWITHSKKISSFDYKEALLAGSEDGSASIYWEEPLILERHCKAVLSVLWLGQWALTGSLDHSVQVWDAKTASPLINFRIFSGAVRVLALHPCMEDSIIAGSDDQTIRILNIFQSFEKNLPKSPPKTSSKQDSYVKTIFPELHKFFYQQTKEKAFEEILELLNGSRSRLEVLGLSKEEIFKEFPVVEVFLWKEISEIQWKNSEFQVVSQDLLPFAMILGFPHVCLYALEKSEKCLLKRKVHQGVIYLLLAQQVDKALSIYLSLNMHLESLVLAAIFGKDLQIVYRSWIARFLRIKKKEQAVKCYLALQDFQSVLDLLDDQTSEKVLEIKTILRTKL
jgi:WD40 repeat protein